MGLIDDYGYFVNLVKDFLFKTYEILVDFTDKVFSFIGLILSAFPYDDAKKTMMLGIIFLFSVFGLILAFNTGDFNSEGITDTGQIISFGLDFNSIGNSEIVGPMGGTGNNTGVNPQLKPSKVESCQSDDDCKTYNGESLNSKCCYPDKYQNYSCAGRCLLDEAWDRDACELPNACIHFGVDFDEFAGDDYNRCDPADSKFANQEYYKWSEADKWCQEQESQDVEDMDGRIKCCGGETMGKVNPCYGYCLKSGGSYSCNDIDACYHQKDPKVIIIEGGDE